MYLTRKFICFIGVLCQLSGLINVSHWALFFLDSFVMSDLYFIFIGHFMDAWVCSLLL